MVGIFCGDVGATGRGLGSIVYIGCVGCDTFGVIGLGDIALGGVLGRGDIGLGGVGSGYFGGIGEYLGCIGSGDVTFGGMGEYLAGGCGVGELGLGGIGEYLGDGDLCVGA